MSRFLELTHLPHDEKDPYAPDRMLPSLLKASPFRLWQLGDQIPRQGTFILLGVATWSGYDMHLLDTLQESLARLSEHPTIGVFNAGILTNQQSIQEYIPGAPFVFHTPAVGVWRDGILTERAEGYLARDLVARMFGSSSDEIVNSVREIHSARAS